MKNSFPLSLSLTILLRRLPAIIALALCGMALMVTRPAAAHNDTAETHKRAQLAHIKRVVVILPFFGTETMSRAAKPAGDHKPGGEPEKSGKPEGEKTEKAPPHPPSALAAADLARYVGYLQKLQEDAQKYLPERLAKRAGFEVVPEAETAAALQSLKLTPEKMFENDGRMKGTRFPLPRAEAIRSVSNALHADAVVLGVLDEPRRANGKYLFDPLYGFSYESGYVEAHGGFYMMLPEGAEALHGYMRVRNPLSKAGGKDFVLADWIDAQELMIENMMDEWTYYTPKK